MPQNQLMLVYTTLASPEQARELGKTLVAEKLAACVNLFPGMTSIYEWNGALDETAETAMIIKTRRARLEALLARAEALHPYEVPALLVLPVEAANSGFAGWIAEQTQTP